MTRKDYLLLATALATAKRNSDYAYDQESMVQQHDCDCKAVADALARQAKGFDRELFLKNCGVQS